MVERAVRSAALALLSRARSVAEVIATLASAVDAAASGAVTPRERAATARKARRDEMVAETVRLEGAGRGRTAVMSVARKFARDPLDPVEVESLARSLRRWRKKNGHCPVVGPQEA
jgi:hypothetical protein